MNCNALISKNQNQCDHNKVLNQKAFYTLKTPHSYTRSEAKDNYRENEGCFNSFFACNKMLCIV